MGYAAYAAVKVTAAMYQRKGRIIGNPLKGVEIKRQNFITKGLLGGIFTVLEFLPYIMIIFVLTTFLEQTGYLARISLLLDHYLEKFGISGRSIISLVTGFGCNVPAILMARNCSSKKEKVVLIMISPFLACSARVIVFN